LSYDVWSRRRRIVLGLAAVSTALGCRCSSEPLGAPTVAAPATDTPDCVRSSIQLTLAPSGSEREPPESPLDPSVELPFATEPGMAVALPAGFFATGLRHESRGAVALLGRVGAEDAPTELVELAHVRGDVLPPRLAGDGADLWIVLQDATPGGGRQLRIGRFAAGELGREVAWRQGPEQTSAESSAFDIAAHAGAAVLAYDDWSASANHGRILVAPIGAVPAEGSRIEGRPVSLPGVDAEAPRISARPGGYWLAWLVNATSAGTGRVYDPGEEANDRAGAGTAYNARWLSLASLDPRGKLIGEPHRLTARQGRVVGYDLATGPSGNAWLTWRQDAPTPGASGGRIAIAEVGADNRPIIRSIRDEDVGAGEPSWLFPGGAVSRWLTFPDSRDQTVLLRVESFGKLSAPLLLGPDLEGAGALAARGEEVLFAVPRGRALELFPATCKRIERAAIRSVDAGLGAAAVVAPDAGPPKPPTTFR
jgi:hypothetical protein